MTQVVGCARRSGAGCGQVVDESEVIPAYRGFSFRVRKLSEWLTVEISPLRSMTSSQNVKSPDNNTYEPGRVLLRFRLRIAHLIIRNATAITLTGGLLGSSRFQFGCQR